MYCDVEIGPQNQRYLLVTGVRWGWLHVPAGPGYSRIEVVGHTEAVDRSCCNKEEEVSNSCSTGSMSEVEGRRKGFYL